MSFRNSNFDDNVATRRVLFVRVQVEGWAEDGGVSILHSEILKASPHHHVRSSDLTPIPLFHCGSQRACTSNPYQIANYWSALIAVIAQNSHGQCAKWLLNNELFSFRVFPCVLCIWARVHVEVCGLACNVTSSPNCVCICLQHRNQCAFVQHRPKVCSGLMRKLWEWPKTKPLFVA